MLLLQPHLCFSIPIEFLMLRTPHFYIKSVKAAKRLGLPLLSTTWEGQGHHKAKYSGSL